MEDRTYSSAAAVPGTLEETSQLEDERYTAAALYGLAGSPDGVALLRERGGDTLSGLLEWAEARDPVLQRYGVGGVARIVAVMPIALVPAHEDHYSPLDTLIAALHCADPQVQCYAAAALGKAAERGGEAATVLAEAGAPVALLGLIKCPEESNMDGKQRSKGVKTGMRACLLRALSKMADNPVCKVVLQNADAVHVLEDVLQEDGITPEIVELVEEAIKKLTT